VRGSLYRLRKNKKGTLERTTAQSHTGSPTQPQAHTDMHSPTQCLLRYAAPRAQSVFCTRATPCSTQWLGCSCEARSASNTRPTPMALRRACTHNARAQHAYALGVPVCSVLCWWRVPSCVYKCTRLDAVRVHTNMRTRVYMCVRARALACLQCTLVLNPNLSACYAHLLAWARMRWLVVCRFKQIFGISSETGREGGPYT